MTAASEMAKHAECLRFVAASSVVFQTDDDFHAAAEAGAAAIAP